MLQAASAAKVSGPVPTPWIKMVAIGDSLTAGMQDANLDHRTQDMAYTKQLANQAGLEYNMPYVDRLGIPPRVFLGTEVDVNRALKDIAAVAAAAALPLGWMEMFGTPPNFLLHPLYSAGEVGKRTPDSLQREQHNLAVPGFEARHMVDCHSVRDFLREENDNISRKAMMPILAPLIHQILQNGSDKVRGSEVDRAVSMKPDLVVLWPGSNDALETVSGGVVDDRRLTPMEDKKWDYWAKDLLGGKWHLKQTETVQKGFASTLAGPGGLIDRLEKETDAEIFLFSVPNVTVVPFLREVGKPLGKLPFQVVLKDGTDVTSALEKWVIPNGVRGYGNNARTEFPAGTRVGLAKLLKKITTWYDPDNLPQFHAALARVSREAIFEENDVLAPDELGKIDQRIGEYNALSKEIASTHARVHLIDINQVLLTAKQSGLDLKGEGDEVKVTTTFCGTTDDRGYEGLFSFDGIHPSDVGHAVVANTLLQKIQQDLGNRDKFKRFLEVPLIDEKAVFAQDPHRGGGARFVLTSASADRLNGPHGSNQEDI